MTKFSYSNNPWFQLLSREQVEAIHLSSLKILEEIGVMIQNETTLRLLIDAGADVDPKKKTARIPQHLAKESLVKAPSTIRLYSRDGKHDLLLEGNKVHYDPGSAALLLLDSKTG